ncbi:uncharacterized protein LOC142180117 [Nicotiana tabacum]|uniref:Uncharacterized protein LOC142180117 n=1 Tax=Nicotiana tabacum TaxID=4097 RepID=A0AC58UCC4_TOBAC
MEIQQQYSKTQDFKKPSGRQGYTEKKVQVEQKGCYICGGLHGFMNCPNLKCLSAMVRERKDHPQGESSKTAQLGMIGLCGAVTKQAIQPTNNDNQYVDLTINNKPTRAMMDTRATPNFGIEAATKKLELKLAPTSSHVKTLNAEVQKSRGVDNGVGVKLVTWKGMTNFTVTAMDIFDIILGKEAKHISQLCRLSRGSRRESKFVATIVCLEEDKCFQETLLPCIEKLLEKNKDVIYEELPNQFPPRRKVDYKIELEPEVSTHIFPISYGTARARGAQAPSSALVLFQKKKDGSMRLSIDFQPLNKVTVINKYLILLITHLFDRLGQTKYFTKVDLCKGYYQVRIAEGDEPKIACVTRHGAFEWLVMPFGLTKEPTTFCTLMNKIFHPYHDQFMVVYLDDIVIYSNTLEEHMEHLRKVFQVLRENELYIKKGKCEFAQSKVHFLGQVISNGELRMDEAKERAI